VVIGLASSGLHSNGFSLIRRLVDDGRLALTDDLLTATRLYAGVVHGLGDVHGMAHVTGGGLARNLPRAVGSSLGVRINPASWRQPEIFNAVARAAGMDDLEMRATFNCGIGFALIVPVDAAAPTISALAGRGMDSWRIGEVRPIDELSGRRYVEA
jgi:phosphoribosylformylglycinamidine cyclo-ligase